MIEVETVPGHCPGPAALGASCEATEAGGQQTEPGRTGAERKKKKHKDKIKRWMKHKQSAEKVHENQFAARTGEKASGHFNKANRIKIF